MAFTPSASLDHIDPSWPQTVPQLVRPTHGRHAHAVDMHHFLGSTLMGTLSSVGNAPVPIAVSLHTRCVRSSRPNAGSHDYSRNQRQDSDLHKRRSGRASHSLSSCCCGTTCPNLARTELTGLHCHLGHGHHRRRDHPAHHGLCQPIGLVPRPRRRPVAGDFPCPAAATPPDRDTSVIAPARVPARQAPGTGIKPDSHLWNAGLWRG
jgi:hypothetical protein